MRFKNMDFSTDLIELAKIGDIDAIEKIIKSFEHLAYNLAFSFLKDKFRAEDVAQEALIKIARNIDKFQNRSKLSTWGYRIIRNCIIDSIRKGKKIRYEELNEFNSGISSDSIEENVHNNEAWSIIRESLSFLSSEKREIIILFDIHGYSFREISELLEIPEGTVKSKWSRAKNKLRKILKEKNLIQVELNN